MNNTEIRQKLLRELDLESVREEARDEIILQFGEIILKSLAVTIYAQLLPEARKEFEELTAQGDEKRVQEFLEQNIPHVNDMLEQEVAKMIKTFKERGRKK
jgi:hypothetical protein